MLHFIQAIKLSLRYKWSIVGAVFCSLMVAILWSASITTVYPVVECVFNKQPLVTLVDTKLEAVVADREVQVAALNEISGRLESAGPDESESLRSELRLKERYRDAADQIISRLEMIRPYVVKYAPKTPFDTLVATMTLLVIATAIKGVFLVLSTVLVARVASGTVMDMRRIYYRKALDLDQFRIDRLGTSAMMTHLSHNMQMVSGGLTMFYGKMIREPLKMLTCLIVAAWICWPLLVISLFVVPIGALVVHFIAKAMKGATNREVAGMTQIFNTLIETLSAIKTVRIFNQERAERRRFKRNAAALYRLSLRMRFFDSLLRPIMELLGIVSIGLALIAGAYLTLSGDRTLFGWHITNRALDPGELMLFYAMLAGASDPARKMSEIVNELVRGGMACQNLDRTYERPNKIVAPANPTPILPHAKEITFDKVVFGYAPKQQVLKKFSFTIPYRQVVAVVGENGSGKSTLVNLLARFYDPQQGRIAIDGIDLRDMNPRKWRRQIAWVTQDSVLFQGTVWENIAYGARSADDGAIANAAKLARVGEFIQELPEGYQTQVGEAGSQLSAGQRQRVALARAIVADPRILVLDEATSQMDGHTEKIVQESLESFIRGRTTIIITHRISTIQLADRVVVMNRGRIVSDSTPEDAVNSSEPFQYLFSRSA